MKLNIGSGLSLPLSLVTSTQAILARKRSGKSYTASVQAEEMLEHKQQVVVIDPTSAWWGLRSSADGKGEGYPVIVFGGDHADTPLDWRAGRAMATAVVEHGFSCIFDMGDFETDEQYQFILDFSKELLRTNKEAMHVFMDEADTFAPQKPLGVLQNKCLGAVTRMVKQGGRKGIGFTMITQRPSDISKSVLSQVDVLTILRMAHPTDIKPAVDWLTSEISPFFARAAEKALPRMEVGEAIVASNTLGIEADSAKIRKRRTFDSGRTPKPGERAEEPKVMASIDIAKLGEKIAASVQRAKEDSPEYLKKRIAELESRKQEPSMEWLEQAQKQSEELKTLRGEVEELRVRARGQFTLINKVRDLLAEFDDGEMIVPPLDPPADKATTQAVPVRRPWVASTQEISIEEARRRFPPAFKPTGNAEQRILGALAQFEAIRISSPSKMHVCLFSGYSNMNTKGFSNAVGAMRSAGLIEYPESGKVSLTEKGRALAPKTPASTSDKDLHSRIASMLSPAESRIFWELIKVYPQTIAREELMRMIGFTNPNTKGFANSLGRLSGLGFAHYPQRGQVAATSMCFLPRMPR